MGYHPTARRNPHSVAICFVIMSISTDELLQRNLRFAAGGAFAGLSFPTSQTLRVLGCVDSRSTRVTSWTSRLARLL